MTPKALLASALAAAVLLPALGAAPASAEDEPRLIGDTTAPVVETSPPAAEASPSTGGVAVPAGEAAAPSGDGSASAGDAAATAGEGSGSAEDTAATAGEGSGSAEGADATAGEGSGSAEDTAATAGDAGDAFSSTYRHNTFERPAAGTAYTLDEWEKDGWYASSARGLEERAVIDDSVPAHGGGQSLRVLYPEGRIGAQESGGLAPFQLSPAREYYLSFWARLGEDFSWGTTSFGGKLGFGLAGGAGCSGGDVCTGENGYSSRVVWRRDGKAELYYYHMDKAGEFGDSEPLVADGSVVHLPRGEWVHIAQRVRVNTVTDGRAEPDGEIEVFYNGEPAALVTGLRLVTDDDLVDKAYLSTFFGGSTEGFAPAHDSYVWYDDLKVSTSRADICELGGCA
ncbi:polysaccharide lyase [Nocardiopsis dassonvillei]|uniref:polysaccharide lyase n=1 Tax=Nocardiopsis dassonvillei TaxID=2014 RepID=UPI0033CEC445